MMKQPISGIPTDYPSLCADFPPRIIQNEKAYQATQFVIGILTKSTRKLNQAQKDYLNLLKQLSDRYDSTRFTKPHRLLKQLVDEHKLRKSDLSRILGRSLALGSMILSGQRKITREHAKRLGKHFGLQPEAFLT